MPLFFWGGFFSSLGLRLRCLHLWYRGMVGFPAIPAIPAIPGILRPELGASLEAQEMQGTHGARGRHLSRFSENAGYKNRSTGSIDISKYR